MSSKPQKKKKCILSPRNLRFTKLTFSSFHHYSHVCSAKQTRRPGHTSLCQAVYATSRQIQQLAVSFLQVVVSWACYVYLDFSRRNNCIKSKDKKVKKNENMLSQKQSFLSCQQNITHMHGGNVSVRKWRTEQDWSRGLPTDNFSAIAEWLKTTRMLP